MESIAEFYAGKTLFITGATGFIGKVLIEKLLRDCSNISQIYILVRAKNGIDPEIRRVNFINNMVFDRIRNEDVKQLDKIKVVGGDVTVDDLGISDLDNKTLIGSVNLIFHCAANVKFDQSIKEAVNFNTAGTLRVLKLATKIKNFRGFIHVSTAYCQCKEAVLEEKFYAAGENPYGMIEMAKTLSNDILEDITPKLLNGLPNTYAFTKSLGEDLVHSYKGKFPIAVCRPAIVTASWKEPFEGWIEGVNGPTGLMIASSRGVIRSMLCNPDYLSESMPVDLTSNAIIAVGWKLCKQKQDNSDEVYYCNLTDSGQNPITWGECLDMGKKLFWESPLSVSLWYPDGTIKTNYYHHMLCVIFFHYLPAYIIDLMLIISFRKPFMVRIQKKVSRGLKVLQYYTMVNWVFKNQNYMNLQAEMSDKDKQTFYLDTKLIDWNIYLKNYILGTRHFLLKETPESIPQARANLKRLYYLDRVVRFLFYAFIIYLLWNNIVSITNVSMGFLEKTKNVVANLPSIWKFF